MNINTLKSQSSRLIASLVFFTMVMASSAIQAGVNEQLKELFDRTWAMGLKSDPVSANSYGNMSDVTGLMDVSESAYQNRLKVNESILNELSTFNYASLSAENKINFDIFKQQISYKISQIEYKTYQIPF